MLLSEMPAKIMFRVSSFGFGVFNPKRETRNSKLKRAFMNIKFWGVRGSIPTPSTPNFSTSRYGGNTTCVSIHTPGRLIILDGGSGLRSLGMWLDNSEPVQGTFFFSHLHWDHIQGF